MKRYIMIPLRGWLKRKRWYKINSSRLETYRDTHKELDKLRATVRLMAQLEEGEKSAREKGRLSADEVEASLGL